MLKVFGIFFILLYFPHSNSNIEPKLVMLLYKLAFAMTKYLR